MKIPNKKNDFLTFNDGVIKLYKTDSNDDIIKSSEKQLCFGNRKIGINRFFLARHNDIELKKLIHTYYDSEITAELAAVIGSTRYKIEQVQPDFESNPKATVLSLSQYGEWIDKAPDG